MTGKQWLAAACVIAGIPLAAYGLAGGGFGFAVLGLALLLVFWYLAWQWLGQAGKPATPIKPAANAAWNMRDQAAGEASPLAPTPSPLAPTPSPSTASGRGEEDGGASRRGFS
jgi:hypothetical protein